MRGSLMPDRLSLRRVRLAKSNLLASGSSGQITSTPDLSVGFVWPKFLLRFSGSGLGFVWPKFALASSGSFGQISLVLGFVRPKKSLLLSTSWPHLLWPSGSSLRHDSR